MGSEMQQAELIAYIKEPILQSGVDKIRAYSERMARLRTKQLTSREAARLDILKARTEAELVDLNLSVMPIFWKSPETYNSGGVEFQHAVWRLGRLADELEKLIVKPSAEGEIKPWHRPAKKGWIYFIVAGEFVKIGNAANIATRIKGLETGSPVELKLLRQERGSLADEARFHQQFAEFRVRGEWFHHAGALAAYIAGDPK